MLSANPHPFRLGVIEGFYGTPWSHEARVSFAEFMVAQGMSFYLYAPKADAYLRKAWRDPIPEAHMAELAALSKAFHGAGALFGVGLSPFEVYREFGAAEKQALSNKIRQLNDVGCDILAILFDDMRGDVPKLAETQVAILDYIEQVTTAGQIIFCPTYYSDDGVLERVFGDMPAGYLDDLGQMLNNAIDIFWTGPKVVSHDYPLDHLEAVAEKLRRKPFLWDNYPVNDSEKMSKHLHLRGVTGRPHGLRNVLAGHAANLALQPMLSRLPLQTLSESYHLGDSYQAEQAFERAVHDQCDAATADALCADLPLLHDAGMDQLSPHQKNALVVKYEALANSPFAQEVVAWLKGVYKFDPACLTD